MDDQLQPTLDRVRAGLEGVPGIVGLALGGSRARGTADPESDIDVGLYYDPERRADFAVLAEALTRLDDRGRPDGCAGYGEWGPWINGGAWLRMAGTKVDILLRDATRTREVLQNCVAGQVEISYQAGHPHGFCSAIYAGEVHQNKPFHDPDGVLADLHRYTEPYPPALAKALIGKFGWESGFALATAATAAGRGDISYVTGCAFRAVACLTQVLFAAEKRYLSNEKGSLALAAAFVTAPADLVERVGAALGRLSPEPADLKAALADLADLQSTVMSQVDQG
jgi:predicted nucleotidyltransferase